MTRKAEQEIRVTHKYVQAPEARERGLQLWASYLAAHLARKLAEEARARQKGTA